MHLTIETAASMIQTLRICSEYYIRNVLNFFFIYRFQKSGFSIKHLPKMPFRLTDPLSTSSVILIEDKGNTINIDQTDSDSDSDSHSIDHRSINDEHSCHLSNSNTQK